MKKTENANSQNELLAMIKLNAAFPYSANKIDQLINIFGSAEEAVKASAKDLFENASFTLDSAEKAVKFFKEFSSEKEMMMAEKNGIKILARNSPEYPKKLAFIYDSPAILYSKGDCSKLEMPSAAIVGTRHPSHYGMRMAYCLSAGIAEYGAAVVSGLAKGIDSAAHRAALSARGTTWAVLGTGLLKTYPHENIRLAEEIADFGGAVISEFPLTQTARPANFPRRNRIISGLSDAVAVIEGSIKSGSLITARCALEQGKDVLALPGHADSIYAQGPHYLIKNGAFVAENAEDIISCLNIKNDKKIHEQKKKEKTAEVPADSLSPETAAIYNVVAEEKKGITADEIILKTGLDAPQVSAAIFEMEVSGLILQRGGRYEIK